MPLDSHARNTTGQKLTGYQSPLLQPSTTTMVANNEGQQAPVFGDPTDPSSSHDTIPRWVPPGIFDDTPVRPSSSASNNSSEDGGVMLPPASVVSSSSHGSSRARSDDHNDDYSQQTTVSYTGATNPRVQAPLPVRIIRNTSIHGAAHANSANVFMDGRPRIASPDTYSVGPDQTASQASVSGNNIDNGAAHANSDDVYTGGLNAHRVDPSISASQSAPQTYANGNNTVNIAAHTNTADAFTGGLNAYRVDSSIPTSQPAYVHGNRTCVINISKSNRIYGNMADNRFSCLDKPTYGSRTRNMNSRIPQAIPGGFGNNSSLALNVGLHPHVNYNAPRQRPVNRMIFQEQHNSQISSNQVPSSQVPNYQISSSQVVPGSQVSNYQASVNQVPNNQLSSTQVPSNRVPNYQVANNQIATYQVPNNQVPNTQVAFRAQVPYQTQLPTPMAMLSSPPGPFAAPGCTRAVTLADMIHSGATDDGQSLNPDAQTPPTGSDRRRRPRANSVQLETPTPTRGSRGSRRNDYGSSEQSTALNTPSRNMCSAGSYGIQTSRTSATSTQNRIHGQVRPPPAWLFEVCNQQPILEEAMESLPLSNPYETVPFRGNGVVKFINIPYTTLRSELIAALGRNARPVNMPLGSPYYAAHIIMDRNTGKTAEVAFVEMLTARDAMNTVRAINRRSEDGSRALKIGNREVTVRVSTTEELMEALFPHACGVEWTGYTPRVIDVDTQFYPDQKGIGFTGFCGNEELSMLVKFAEHTSRSPFIQRTPHRLYECLISTLHRLPWRTPRYITLAQRKKLFETVQSCMKALFTVLDSDERERHVGLSEVLLQELATAALSCVGFSEQQKSSLVEDLTAHGHLAFAMGHSMNVHLGGSGIFSASWPFLALTPQAFVNNDMLKFYISLISKASEVDKDTSLYNMMAHLEVNPRPFGRFAINYTSRDMADLSLEDIVRTELDAVARVLSNVLLGGCSGPLFELE